MSCQKCGMSFNNSVHKNKRQYGYHEYVQPPVEEYKPSLEERVAELERRVTELEESSKFSSPLPTSEWE
jgi:hypothetical protein